MKKNGSLALSLAFVAVLGMSFTGCGSTDDAVEAYDDYTGGDKYIPNDDYTGGNINVDDYSYITIYKNMSGELKDELLSGYEGYNGFQMEAVSNSTSCTDYGFSRSDDTYDYGYGKVTSYYSSDYTRFCSETDFSGYDYYSGNEAVLFTYNY